MTHVTYTSHPRVTMEHRVSGPMVAYNKHTETSAALGRSVAIGAAVIGLMVFADGLIQSWRSGWILWLQWSVVALAIGLPVVGIAYKQIAARNREEVALAGDWLQIRPRPFNLGRGQDVRREDIDRVQVEERFGYRIQFVDGEGFGMLPQNNSLTGINTQDEATAMAASVARLFGLRFVPGVQPRAIPSPSLGEEVAITPGHKAKPTMVKPVDPVPGTVKGALRARQSKTGEMLTFTMSTKFRAGYGLFAVAALAVCAAILLSLFSSGADISETGESFIVMVGFGLGGLGMLGKAIAHKEFQLDGDALVYRTRLVFIPLPGGRIPLADLNRVGVEVYWDSYNTMHHRVVAKVDAPIFGDARVLVDEVSQADGHALCMALHRQFGLPI